MIYESELERLCELNTYSKLGFNYYKNKGFKNDSTISDFAKILIDDYTGFCKINDCLRRKNPHTVEISFYKYLLNKALDEIEGYNSKTVFRMDNPDIDFETLKIWYRKRIGHFICFPNFLSTSKDRWQNGNIVFKIHTSNNSLAKDLTKIINIEKAKLEKEVLFKTRSVFEIHQVHDDFIELYEVSHGVADIITIYDNTYINDSDVIEFLGLTEDDDDYLDEIF